MEETHEAGSPWWYQCRKSVSKLIRQSPEPMMMAMVTAERERDKKSTLCNCDEPSSHRWRLSRLCSRSQKARGSPRLPGKSHKVPCMGPVSFSEDCRRVDFGLTQQHSADRSFLPRFALLALLSCKAAKRLLEERAALCTKNQPRSPLLHACFSTRIRAQSTISRCKPLQPLAAAAEVFSRATRSHFSRDSIRNVSPA